MKDWYTFKKKKKTNWSRFSPIIFSIGLTQWGIPKHPNGCKEFDF